MNILRENIGQLNDIITIEIVPTDYNEQVEKSLKDLKRKANVPGFRAGHVPMGMIQKMYKRSIVADEISKMINDQLLNYLKENNIDILFEPIALPDKTKGDFEKEEDSFNFSFEIGIHPEFDIDYEKAKSIKLLKINASDKEIDEEIKKLQHKTGKFSSTETVAEEDMMLVTVLAEGDVKEEFTSSLLLSYVNDAHQKDFIGKKLHDTFSINTTEIFKGDYERSTFLKTKVEALADAPTTINVKIDAIHHIEPSELNQEFYTKAFPNGNVNDKKSLRNYFKTQIELAYERDEKMFYRSKIMDYLIENTNITLPDDFIKRFLIETKGEQYTRENMEEQFKDIKTSIIYQLIEDKIAKDGNIKIENDEISHYIKDYIRNSYFGMNSNENLSEDQEKMITNFSNEMMKKQENVKNAYENVFSEKIINELLTKINPKIERVSFDQFLEAAAEKSEDKKTKKASSKK